MLRQQVGRGYTTARLRLSWQGGFAPVASPKEEPPTRNAMSDPAAIIELPTDAPAKKQPKRHRSRLKVARYSPDEAAEFDRLATAAGLSDSAFIRVSTIGKQGLPRSRRRPPDEQEQLKLQHVIAINRAGGLVNQGIRALHEIRQAAPAAVERDRLAYELEAVRKLLESAIPALNEALAAVDREPRA
jgi:hypothetical protein